MNEPWEILARQMVEMQMRRRGITDERVLAAIAQIPRHRFLAGGEHAAVDPAAYADGPAAIGFGQTISQPYIVAMMTQVLKLLPGMKVLEVGTGSGYQTAVLAKFGARVVSVERSPELAARASAILAELGLAEGVKIVVGDGTLGLPAEAPFDRILVTAAAPQLPSEYRRQLADAGRIVIPLGPREEQDLFIFNRYGDLWVRTPVIGCRFVPLVGAAGWPAEPV